MPSPTGNEFVGAEQGSIVFAEAAPARPLATAAPALPAVGIAIGSSATPTHDANDGDFVAAY